ncbi:MAG: hypothetical protein HZA95_02270 [Candidatus Vogelbacteria bacterium]|nr:hypothetical protein [Candidatus Vogelbacteria bacterium]
MKIMKYLDRLKGFVVYFAVVALMPGVAYAQDLQGIIRIVTQILGGLVKVLLGLALIYFIWEVAQYIGKGGSKDVIDKIVWSVVAMFVMVSVWGLVALINTTFSIDAGGSAPQISF